MKKLIFPLIVVFVFTGMTLSAVDLAWGVKGGVNFAHFSGDDASADGDYDSDSKTGFTAGVFFLVPVKDIVSIQPSLLFTMKGQKKEEIGISGFKYDSLYYIEVPVLVKVYPPLKLPGGDKYNANAFAGPYLGINLFNKYRTTGQVRDDLIAAGDPTKGDYEDVRILDFGLVIGIGADIKNILIEASYSMGLITSDSSTIGYDLKNRVLTLMVGYNFGKKDILPARKKKKD